MYPNLFLTILALAAIAWLLVSWSRGFRRGGLIAAINTLPGNVGTSKCKRRYRASAAMATRYLFVKAGADDEHIAAVTATADKPLGVATDEAAAAEDPVDVELPITNRTLVLVAAEALAALNVELYMTAAGKVGLKPTAAGTYWKVARNKTVAAAVDDPVECELLEPRKLVVIAALTQTSAATIAGLNSTAVNPTKADYDLLLAEAGKLQADFYALKAGMNADADIAWATS
jgi:hypothetical protein